MNKIRFCLVLIILPMMLITKAYSEEEDQLPKWETQPATIQFSSKVRSGDGTSVANGKNILTSAETVDKVAEFLLETPHGTASDTTYDLYFYMDKHLEDKVESISLPFTFKQNFSGLNGGTYQLMFMLVDKEGNVGRVQKTITVQHRQ